MKTGLMGLMKRCNGFEGENRKNGRWGREYLDWLMNDEVKSVAVEWNWRIEPKTKRQEILDGGSVFCCSRILINPLYEREW
jgi:hypothetical protein